MGVQGFRDDYEEHILRHRCLGSLKNPVPCVALCPAGVDIPGYIALVSQGRYADAVKLIRENLALTRLEEGAQVVCGDSMAYLNALREKFDLIFLDPPYADDLLERAVAHIARFDILAPDGIMIAESPAEKELPKLSAPYRVAREYRYGRIKVTLYRRDGEETT